MQQGALLRGRQKGDPKEEHPLQFEERELSEEQDKKRT
jgi:hypothetical protein